MLKILPPIWYFLLLLIALILHFVLPATRVFNLIGVVYDVLGAVLFVFGMGLSIQASKQFAEEKTEILPTSPTNRVLITKGMYKFTRNPMYLGMFLSLVGIGIFIGTLPVLVAAIIHLLIMNFVFVPFEEQKMLRIFGDQYLTYKKSVRRWI